LPSLVSPRSGPSRHPRAPVPRPWLRGARDQEYSTRPLTRWRVDSRRRRYRRRRSSVHAGSSPDAARSVGSFDSHVDLGRVARSRTRRRRRHLQPRRRAVRMHPLVCRAPPSLAGHRGAASGVLPRARRYASLAVRQKSDIVMNIRASVQQAGCLPCPTSDVSLLVRQGVFRTEARLNLLLMRKARAVASCRTIRRDRVDVDIVQRRRIYRLSLDRMAGRRPASGRRHASGRRRPGGRADLRLRGGTASKLRLVSVRLPGDPAKLSCRGLRLSERRP
jgi:hypothetical protein